MALIGHSGGNPLVAAPETATSGFCRPEPFNPNPFIVARATTERPRIVTSAFRVVDKPVDNSPRRARSRSASPAAMLPMDLKVMAQM